MELQLLSTTSDSSGLISFRTDWFDLLVVQRTLKGLLQHHNSKHIPASALSLLYGPALTSVHDCWKNHTFDSAGLCEQRDVSVFNTLSNSSQLPF